MNPEFDTSEVPQQPEADPFDASFTDDAVRALVEALPATAADTADDKLCRKSAAMHLLRSLDAQDPIEAALATQAVLAHYWSVAAFQRAATSGHLPGTTASEIDIALRSSERFCHLLDELDRWQDGVSPIEVESHKSIL